ncbi:MAG: molybdopterin cofactor-binding domain-containing protein, partial [Burkholderiales bacterium]
EGDFFRERLFDIAAGELGIDPVEFRRRNLPQKHEFPFPLPKINLPEKTDELDSGDYQTTFDRCLAEFDWNEKKKLQGKLIDGRYHGIALGCFMEGGAAGPSENARLVVETNGNVSVYVGSSGVGQGLETVMLQIAGDALGVPMERLEIFHGSTTGVEEGYGSYHSRSTVMGGSAVLLAAEALKTKLRDVAAARFGCAAKDVAIGSGLVATHGVQSASLRDLAADTSISVESKFLNHRHTYSGGTSAAHVTVDPRTGQVKLLDYLTVEDIGKIVNPLMAIGQINGSVMQGLGGALLEHLQYDEHGQFLTASLADYLLPTASDFPNIRAIALENAPSPINPMGAKGVGEGGIVPVGGLIANAVAAALASFGVSPRTLPLTPARVWQDIQDARKKCAS